MSTQPRRLDVGTLRPQDVELTIDGQVYLIRGDISIDDQVALFAMEQRLDKVSSSPERIAAASPEERERIAIEEAQESIAALADANRMIVAMIHERYPDAKIPAFGLQEVIGILGFIVGNPDGPAAAIEEALVAGAPVPSDEEVEKRVQEHLERERARARGETVSDPPTSPSESVSSTFSSPSESASSGGPSGGGESPGEPSEPIASASTA